MTAANHSLQQTFETHHSAGKQHSVGRRQTARKQQSMRRSGFTLVEMLVVIVIIAILATIIVPVGFIAVTRAKEMKIITQVKQLEVAVEQHKTKFSVQPIDMTNPLMLAPYINKISRKHKYGASIFDPSNINNPATLYGGDLPNPHVADFGGPANRNMNRMDQCEAFVFFMTEISKNVDYPLGYRYDMSTNAWVYLPGDRYEFAKIKDTDLRDQDQDGWLEVVQTAGPALPIAYFDARTYLVPVYDASWNITDYDSNNFISQTSKFDSAAYYVEAQGVAQPYWKTWDAATPADWPASWNEESEFQLVAPGMDGDYGLGYTRASYESKQHDMAKGNYILSPGDLDNVGCWSEGRMDKNYDQ